MIAKITRGSSARGLANYLHGPGKANEHTYDGQMGGRVIGGTLGADGARDGSVWARDMEQLMGARPDVERPVWHMSLRLPAGDPTLTDAGWRQIGQEMGERMGWAEQPWVMVRHGDDHVHIAVSRVGFDGQLWHAKNDYREAQKARQAVEKQWGLTQTPARASKGLREAPVTSQEYSKALRTAEVPARDVLRVRVQEAVEAARGLGREQFEALLKGQGVDYRANVASTGRVSGYSFALPGNVNDQGEQVWFKASQLDRSLSWSKVAPQLDAPLPEPKITEPPKKLFETRNRHAERVAAAREQARAKARQQRIREAPVAVKERVTKRSTGQVLRWRGRHASSVRTRVPKERAELARVKKFYREMIADRSPLRATQKAPRQAPAARASSSLGKGLARFVVAAVQEQTPDRGRGMSR